MSVNPRPRPAFGAGPITRRAASEIAVPTEDVAPVESGNAPKRSKGKGASKTRTKAEPKIEAKKTSGTKDDKPVDLVVRLKKSQRRRLKERAAVHGMTPEEAVRQLVQLWLDG